MLGGIAVVQMVDKKVLLMADMKVDVKVDWMVEK
jgi:hypothetical protein